MLSYDIYAYGQMIRDSVRTDAYVEALRRSITPDSVVLDLGTGVGIWALLACKFGARKVYAIDPNEVIHVAKETAAVNGFSDRIEFIQRMSTDITLSEPANVLVVEMHGVVPMFEQNLPSIIDARERLLSADSKMIPQQETLWAAPVESPESFDHIARPWSDHPGGFDWTPAQRVAANDWFRNKAKTAASRLLAEPQCWATLDYRKITSANVSGELKWNAEQTGTGHGILVWFDSKLTSDLGFSNAPGLPETIFGQAFFPWLRPVPISKGDSIAVSLRCDLVETYHLWRWKTAIEGMGQSKAEFAQSSFVHMPLFHSIFDEHHKPELNRAGEIQRFVLAKMDGDRSIGNIAAQCLQHFPEDFRDLTAAKRRVAELATRYSNVRASY